MKKKTTKNVDRHASGLFKLKYTIYCFCCYYVAHSSLPSASN